MSPHILKLAKGIIGDTFGKIAYRCVCKLIPCIHGVFSAHSDDGFLPMRQCPANRITGTLGNLQGIARFGLLKCEQFWLKCDILYVAGGDAFFRSRIIRLNAEWAMGAAGKLLFKTASLAWAAKPLIFRIPGLPAWRKAPIIEI